GRDASDSRLAGVHANRSRLLLPSLWRRGKVSICLESLSSAGGKASNTIAQFALDFPRKESVCGDPGRRACPACSSHPASADRPPRGLGGGGALLRRRS